MSDELGDREEILAAIKGTHDSLNVRRVYGDPIQVDDSTIIPVAKVAGGAGGGGGSGTDGSDSSGEGFGTGFGMGARPVGVYVVKDGEVSWRRAVDAQQVVALVAIVALAVVAVVWRWTR